jgi:PST family polysaccharide transporter
MDNVRSTPGIVDEGLVEQSKSDVPLDVAPEGIARSARLPLVREPPTPRAESRPTRDYLSTDHLLKDIGKRSVHGGVATLLSQHAKAVIDIVAQLALARILVPGDFGVVAMVVVITRFAMLLMELGLSTATVQSEQLEHQQISALFWLNVFAGSSLAVLLVVVSPLVSMLYGEPRLVGIFAVLALSLVLAGCSVQHKALLRRQMQFKRFAACGVSAVACAAIVALVLALLGAGFWSLVAMHVTHSATMTSGLWIACKWRPKWTARFSSVRPILAFGGRLTGFEVFDYAARNLDRVLVGVFFGARWLGLYAQAVELFLTSTKQICIPVSEVTVAGLSRLQIDRPKFRSYFLNSLSFVLSISALIAGVFAVLAPELLVTVLGDHWLDAAPILRVLAVCGLVYPITRVTQWLYKATGRGRQMLTWGIVSSVASVAAFLVGIPFGVEAMAISFTVCTFVLLVPCVHFATRDTGVTNWDVWRTTARPLLAALLSAGIGVALKIYAFGSWPAWATLVVTTAAMVVVYCLVLLHGMGMKSQLMGFWGTMKTRKQ